MTSIEIKSLLRAKSIPMWKIGDILGVSDVTIQRYLRREQPQHEKEILEAIETLINEKKGIKLNGTYCN